MKTYYKNEIGNIKIPPEMKIGIDYDIYNILIEGIFRGTKIEVNIPKFLYSGKYSSENVLPMEPITDIVNELIRADIWGILE